MNRVLLASGIAAAAATSLIGGAATATAAPAAHKPAHAHTRVISDCVHAIYKPTSIILTCGDAGQELTAISYTHWTAHSAAGKGVLVVDDCVPNCAAGKPIRTAVRFELEKPTRKSHRFSRLVMTYTHHGKTGHSTVELVTTGL